MRLGAPFTQDDRFWGDEKVPEVHMQILRLTTPNLHPSDEDLSLGARN